jgi:predicted transcriptional regulator
MIRTTVYLDEGDAAALRRMAAQTGRSQASIIREAVAEVTKREPTGRRSERIVREEFGRRRR